MAPFLYRCPIVKLTVQGWSAEDVTDEDAETYETVRCTACAQLHFVNPRTGKVLSKRDE
jgi:hypothetical protein